jgi:hypothetical protein
MTLITALRTDVKGESTIILMSHDESFIKEGEWIGYGIGRKMES